MSSSPSNSPSGIETDLIYSSTRLTVQTFFFGVYSVLAVLSVRMLLKRGLKTRANHVMSICTIFTYLLSATYWTYSVCDFMDRMRIYIHYLRDPLDFSSTFSLDSDHDAVGKWSPLFNAMMLVNYIFSDAIVVWRAWIISWRGYRKYLCVTGLFLVLTAVTITCTIIFRIIALVESPYASLPHSNYLTWGVDILQIANIGFSLISNLSATAVVGATAWRHRRSIRAAFADNKKNTKADQILSLVVESGAGYCVSGLTVLIASLVRLPHGTLGDIYTLINVQIAGAYPSVVLLLIRLNDLATY
ncbi:hypothetical protein MVEN_00506700 [Mycena venus]|uniref:Uncharacterized protein n=1 Tax=Mycena venus TaxID=2733690 RepID=A0A8H6YMB1_9AGAR|nr:hypothetical protein MVEN_00506700 [Mycena venus]